MKFFDLAVSLVLSEDANGLPDIQKRSLLNEYGILLNSEQEEETLTNDEIQLISDLWRTGKNKNAARIKPGIIELYFSLSPQNSFEICISRVSVSSVTKGYSLDLSGKKISGDVQFFECSFPNGIKMDFCELDNLELVDCEIGKNLRGEEHHQRSNRPFYPSIYAPSLKLNGNLTIKNRFEDSYLENVGSFSPEFKEIVTRTPKIEGDIHMPFCNIEGLFRLEGANIDGVVLIEKSKINYFTINSIVATNFALISIMTKFINIKIKNSLIFTKSFVGILECDIPYEDDPQNNRIERLYDFLKQKCDINQNVNLQYSETNEFLFSNNVIYGKICLDNVSILGSTEIENSLLISNFYALSLSSINILFSRINGGFFSISDLEKIDFGVKKPDNIYSTISMVNSNHENIGIYKKCISFGQINLTGSSFKNLRLYLGYFISPYADSYALKMARVNCKGSIYFNTTNKNKYDNDFNDLREIRNRCIYRLIEISIIPSIYFLNFIFIFIILDEIIERHPIHGSNIPSLEHKRSYIIGKLDLRGSQIDKSLDFAGCILMRYKSLYKSNVTTDTDFKLWNIKVGENIFLNSPKDSNIPGFVLIGKMSLKGGECHTFCIDKKLVELYPVNRRQPLSFYKPEINLHLFEYHEIISDITENERNMKWLSAPCEDNENQSFPFEQYAKVMFRNGNDDLGLKSLFWGKFFNNNFKSKGIKSLFLRVQKTLE